MSERPSFLSLVSPPPLKQRQRPSSLTITTNGALPSPLVSSSSSMSSSAEVSSPRSLAQPWRSVKIARTGFITTPLDEFIIIKTPTRSLQTPEGSLKHPSEDFPFSLHKDERSLRVKNIKIDPEERDKFLYKKVANGEPLLHKIEVTDWDDTTTSTDSNPPNDEDLSWTNENDINAMDCNDHDMNNLFFIGSSSFASFNSVKPTTPGGRAIKKGRRTPVGTPILTPSSGPDFTRFGLPSFPEATMEQTFMVDEERWNWN